MCNPLAIWCLVSCFYGLHWVQHITSCGISVSGVWVFEAEEKDADSESAKEYRPQRNPRKGRKGTEIQICQLEIALWSPGRKCCMYSASPWNYGWFTRGSNVRTDKLIWSDDNFLQKLHQVPSELERFLGYPTKQANEIWSHCNQVAKISQGASTSQIHLCTGHSHSSKVWLLRH